MPNKENTIWFTPEIGIDPELDFSGLTIKGNIPKLDYPFELRGLYATIPSLIASEAYEIISKELLKLNDLLHEKLHLRDKFEIPLFVTDTEARSLLSILFNPFTYSTYGLTTSLKDYQNSQVSILQLSNIFPFALKLASPQKLAHTLVWIDTNIKVKLESIGNSIGLKSNIIIQLAEIALKIYSYFVKMDDYTLARSMNFNYSMFLQDKILNLILGDAIYFQGEEIEEKGRLSNKMALLLFKNLGSLSYRQLITLSTFMGVVWTSVKDIQKEYEANPESALTKIEKQLKSEERSMCIDHGEQFLKDLFNCERNEIVVILDDNGESAIDLVLYQRLLDDFPELKLTFIVNLYPISNNISLSIFQSLLDDDYFLPMRQAAQTGRIRILIEEQTFRSFELDFLKRESILAIKSSDFVFIKGLNFFETFQLVSVPRYHCFTVYGPTSISLTGCQEGSGIFAKVPAGKTGFVYNNYNQIETLHQIVAKSEMNYAK